MQLTIGLSITLVIVGLALLVGQIIRMSPIMAEWLLGVKKHRDIKPEHSESMQPLREPAA